MPVITVTLIEGYDDTTRERLAKSLTTAAQAVIGAPLDGVTVTIQELPPANYMRGGQRRTPGTAPIPGSDIVRAYLSAMEARDLTAAASYLSNEATLVFPGAQTFNSLEAMVAWAKTRYKQVAKTYERFDEAVAEDGHIVICQGTLYGEWLDGTSFSGIRFIDWFLIENGKIVKQRVWNDLAETTQR